MELFQSSMRGQNGRIPETFFSAKGTAGDTRNERSLLGVRAVVRCGAPTADESFIYIHKHTTRAFLIIGL
jgi:hypothetical protein